MAKQKRSFSFPKPPIKIAYGQYRCETCIDKEIPRARDDKPRYAEYAVGLKTSKGVAELVLCVRHYVASQKLVDWLELADDAKAAEISAAKGDLVQ